MLKLHIFALLTAAGSAFGACGHGGANTQGADTSVTDDAVTVPRFDADSAYAYVRAQTLMGPRTPGSAANRACRAWMAQKLKDAGADTVIVQQATIPGPDGRPLDIANIMGRFNTKAHDRTLLLAHYDTRPWADNDPDAANHSKPIDGANDGASGVAVLLELARHLDGLGDRGVDILMVDAEDSGETDGDDLTWCLGSQYWVRNMPYNPAAMPRRAILLDMVGARDAVMRHEYFGYQAAPQLAQQVWQAARDAGYAQRFADSMGGAVNDDHVHLIAAGIPTIDIIEIDHPQTGSFNPTWHTLADNLDNIDPATLQAVGQTLLQFLYSHN